MPAIRTLVVSAEAYPLAKTGGLGDAVTGMAVAMTRAGIETDVLIPAYRGVLSGLAKSRVLATLDDIPGGPAQLVRGVCKDSGLPILALRSDALYDRDGLYVDEDGCEYADNALRFAALAHAAVRVAQGLPGLHSPHVVHAHDWHAGLVPLLMHAAGVHGVKSVLTLHNMAFQGLFPVEHASAIGLPAHYCTDEDALAWGKINYLKAGIRYAHRVTTVSRNYGREILTPAFGCGLDPLLASRASDLVSIANGIDDRTWDPARDPALGDMRYGARDIRNKVRCKQALQREFGLQQDPGKVLLAMGSRLTHQKMADVVVHALPMALDAHPSLQAAIIGRGDHAIEQALLALAQRYPGRCGVHIGYDEPSGHRLHAGADMLLHGSRFEPFGLTPLYAMRYGTIPIGSRVGGMVDTISDPGPDAAAEAMRSATGVLFEGETPQAMAQAIDRALDLHARTPVWRAMQRNGMTADFSWRTAVEPYARLFRELVGPLPETGKALRPLARPMAQPALVALPKRPGRRPGVTGVAAAA